MVINSVVFARPFPFSDILIAEAVAQNEVGISLLS